jgi:hypothetical protein
VQLFRVLVANRGGVLLWIIQVGDSIAKCKNNGENLGEQIAMSLLKEWGGVANEVSGEEFKKSLDKVLHNKFQPKSESAATTDTPSNVKGKTQPGSNASNKPLENRDPVAQLTSRVLGVSCKYSYNY